MANRVSENDVDVAEIREKLTPIQAEDALSYLNEAAAIMQPLRKGYPKGHSPEILRALQMVIDAMAEALNELDPDEQQSESEDAQAYM